jgi:hypothetical protein
MNAVGRLRVHWPEYLMEAGELALYMFFACAFATLLQHPVLARALDLFHCADIGHAGRRGGFSASSPGRRSVLCEAAPRQ